MAPKRAFSKLTPQEQAANYQRRARELSLKADRKQLEQLLAKHPHLASPLLQEAKNLGYCVDDDASEGFNGEIPSLQVAARREVVAAKRAKTAVSDDGGTDGGADSAQPATIPTKYWTMGSLSVALLCKNVLSEMEPVALSQANLRSMYVRGKGEHGKHELLKIVEFATGLHADTPLVGNLREWKVLRDTVLERNATLGRRAMDLQLPPDWKAAGTYSVNIEGDTLLVKHKPSGATHAFNKELLGCELSKWKVECNWSEQRATLHCADATQSAKPISLYNFFVLGSSSSCVPTAMQGSGTPSPGLSGSQGLKGEIHSHKSPEFAETPVTPKPPKGSGKTGGLAAKDLGSTEKLPMPDGLKAHDVVDEHDVVPPLS
jgi:hypothetical protein